MEIWITKGPGGEKERKAFPRALSVMVLAAFLQILDYSDFFDLTEIALRIIN
jgi:hypothetical protein